MEDTEQKIALRSETKQVLEAIPDREERSKALLDQLLERGLLKAGQVVALFISFPDEIDTMPIVRHCWDQGITVTVPEFSFDDLDGRLEVKVWEPEGDLREATSGVYHPIDGDFMTPDQLDLVLVPGLLFTADGHRLGRGAGFYDRFLAAFEGQTVGLCFSEQIKNDLPMNEHDQVVDIVLSC